VHVSLPSHLSCTPQKKWDGWMYAPLFPPPPPPPSPRPHTVLLSPFRFFVDVVVMTVSATLSPAPPFKNRPQLSSSLWDRMRDPSSCLYPSLCSASACVSWAFREPLCSPCTCSSLFPLDILPAKFCFAIFTSGGGDGVIPAHEFAFSRSHERQIDGALK